MVEILVSAHSFVKAPAKRHEFGDSQLSARAVGEKPEALEGADRIC
jgi:hypothetical protein